MGNIIDQIDELLDRYKKVLLAADQASLDWLRRAAADQEHIMILSPFKPREEINCDWLQIESGEYEMLMDLYNMYEFSDGFGVVGEESRFGGLKNYLDTGILSAEEMAQSLFARH